MSEKKLFEIIIKVFGLFFIKLTLIQIIQIIVSLMFFIANGSNASNLLIMFVQSLLILIIYLFIANKLIFKTTEICNFFQFSEKFENENIHWNLDEKFLIKTSLIFISGFILIEELPALFGDIYKYVSYRQNRDFQQSFDFTHLVQNIIKIVIALLIIGERNQIIDLIIKRKIKN